MADSPQRDAWMARVLGTAFSKTAGASPAAIAATLPAPSGQGLKLGQGRPRSGRVIAPMVPAPAQEFSGSSGQKICIAKTAKGGVVYTAPPPPVREITFSGGGGKGVALPGAVRALQNSGVLKDTTKVAGASVGSMTAALVAAGITAEEFDDVANDAETTDRITEGTGGSKLGLLVAAMKNKLTTGSGSPLTGDGLESIVRDVLDQTLRKRMLEYMTACGQKGDPPDPAVVKIADRLSSNRAGPTFGELRTLSRIIPAVKEVVITGTYTKEFTTRDDGGLDELAGGNDRGQLYVFDADSEPDLEVAVAVHASASFPAVFKPVDIKLSNGLTVRFIDGGVMNNTPTSSSLGRERKIDPMPEGRGITFVFEDPQGVSEGLLKGKVTPAQGIKAKLVDWFVGAEHNAAEYAKNRDLADRPEELVVVPLTFELPPKKKGGKPEIYDMRDGTLDFSPPEAVKLGLQQKTEQATLQQIESNRQPQAREFSSDSQMFVSIPLPEVQALADSGYAGAAEAVAFRRDVVKTMASLQAAAKTAGPALLGNPAVKAGLALLDELAGDDVDFQGFVGREMNRGGLDSLIAAARKAGASGGVIEASFVVNEALLARDHARNVLEQLVYPKMKHEKKGGTAIEVLLAVERMLRAARSMAEVNGAIQSAVNHFKNKSDRSIPRRGHKKFAQAMSGMMMSKLA